MAGEKQDHLSLQEVDKISQQQNEETEIFIEQLKATRLSELMNELSILSSDLKLFENEIRFHESSPKLLKRKERTSLKISFVRDEIEFRILSASKSSQTWSSESRPRFD